MNEAPVKRWELDALAKELLRDREQSRADRKLDREQAARDSAEIKALLKESNELTRQAMTDHRKEVRDEIAEIKENYVKKDTLTIRLSPYEPIRKFFWWFARIIGAMFLATVYQLIINGIKAS